MPKGMKQWGFWCLILMGMVSGNAQLGTLTKSRVSSGDVSLMTRLILPETPMAQKPPVVIIVHGSGRRGNWTTYRPLISRFSQQGMAVVFFDKRGTGASGGRFLKVTTETSKDVFDTLSDDVVAVAQWTKRQAGIDTTRIGVLGFSQGGWIAPLVACKSELIKFSIMISGPIYSLGHETLFSKLAGDARGKEPVDWEEINTKLRAFNADRGFDSEEYVTQLAIPSLWLFGEKDTSMPVTFSKQNLDTILARAPERPFKYIVYPNANHSLYDVDTKERIPYGRDVRQWLLSELY
ncbi:alpha/beta fold hydrolase [Flavobacteriaceae bacterium 3-367]